MVSTSLSTPTLCRRRTLRWWHVKALVLALVAASALPGYGAGPTSTLSSAAASGSPATSVVDVTAEERAVAFGLLLDTPVSDAVIRESLALAEALRRIYGIDTGNVYRDRQTATERARTEVLEPLLFTTEQIKATATDLGYRLNPEHCRDFCHHVEELARVELKKRALRDFVRNRLE